MVFLPVDGVRSVINPVEFKPENDIFPNDIFLSLKQLVVATLFPLFLLLSVLKDSSFPSLVKLFFLSRLYYNCVVVFLALVISA
jgi:hypothetical protein